MPDSISIQDDQQSLIRSVRIDAPNGKVAWEDIFRAVARLRGFSDKELKNSLSKGTIDLNNRFVSKTLTGLNFTFAPHVSFRLTKNNDSMTQLLVSIDRESMLEKRRDIKTDIRSKVVEKWPLVKPSDFGITMDSTWKTCRPDDPLVIAIHGYNSGPAAAAELLDLPRAEGLPCGVFHYPNDQAVTDSANLLSNELKDLIRLAPERNVAIVAHSMGGVLSRAVVEDPQLDPGNVARLIMISPPNHGSELARFAVLADVGEFVGGLVDRDEFRSIFDAVEDGLGEAPVDLEPGSVFLAKLNRRGRNPNVKYSILTGTSAPISSQDMKAVRGRLSQLSSRSRWVKFMVSNLDNNLARLDEVVDGRGDGVVSYKRARLNGVDDIVALRFGHNHPIATKRTGDAERVHQEVLKRLTN